MSQQLAQTPLHSWHAANGGRLVDFAGWSMPVQYGSIVEEHHACRRACGLFDVSHMGRLRFSGARAGAMLDSLLTRKVLGMGEGKVRYSLMCRADGGILDDVLVYRLGSEDFSLVVNASNREKIVGSINAAHHEFSDVAFTDTTVETAMIAVQGPLALEKLAPMTSHPLGEMGYYTVARAKINGMEALVSRTGYTGEDGYELIVPAGAAESIWSALIATGARAVGLGARDTLRLEAGMPLYGHELSETIDPLTAGLGFAVNTTGRSFMGRDALAAKEKNPPSMMRVGLSSTSRRVPREHFAVYAGEERIGETTSGTFSPTLDRPIAMAYVASHYAAIGTQVAIDIRGSREPAEVVALPFYKRASNNPTAAVSK